MLTSDQIDVLRDLSGQVVDPVVEFLIRDIARRIAAAGQVTSTAAYQIWRAQNLGLSQKKVMARVRKLLGASQDEMEALLERSAELGHGYDLARFPTVEAVPFAENTSLQQILDASVQMAREDFTNVTQTLGFVTYDGKCEELTRAYEKSCDYAFQKVVAGAQSYTEAIRDAVRGLAEKGIRSIDYESGVHRSLEAAVRSSIMGGLGLMQEKISQQNHDDLGCDGWEISAHAASAPDHEPIQGKQYSDEAYTRLNNSLVRRIGTLNCGHSASPIILGVNSPQYTDQELEELRRANEEGITYDGKHYTMYEATQRQRSLERAMRNRKRLIIDDETKDKERLQQDQIRLVRTREEYHRFSKAAGLREQWERTEAAGFSWKHDKAATKSANAYYEYWSKSIGANESAKTLADYYEMKYNRPEEYKLLKQYAKDVKTGWISPLSGFENYKNLHGRIQTEIVGQTAADGTRITGQVPHFMQRVIGTMVDPEKLKNDLQVIRRSGVEVDDIAEALFRPESIDPPVKRASGKTSVRFIGSKCVVTINPDEGLLIQTNPRKVKK